MKHFKRFLFSSILVSVLFSGLILLSRCTFKKPVSPSWDVEFTVPLVERKYTMVDLTEDDKNFIIENNDVVFTFNEEIGPFRVGDNLRSGGATVKKTVGFGTASDAAALPDTIVVTSAVLKKGHVRVEIQNTHAYGIQANFVLREMKKPGGSMFSVNFNIPPNNNFSSDYDLAGCRFDTTPLNGRNVVYYDATLTGGPLGDLVNLKLEISDIIYSSLTGKLKAVDVSFNDVNTDIDLPDEIKGFKIGSATADLTILNGIQFPARLEMNVKGTDKEGKTAILAVPPMNVSKAPGQNQKSSTTVSIKNMEEIVNLYPKRIDFSGRASLGDASTQASITEWDELGGKILFKAPMIFTLPDTTLETDVDTLNIDKDARDQFKNVNFASLVTQVDNHLPIGFTLSVFFSNTIGDKRIYQNFRLKREVVVTPAPVSGTPGVVTAEAKSFFEFRLDKADWAIFQEPTVYQGIRIVFPGTAHQMVRILPTDYIRVRTRAEASMRTDFEKDDETKGGGK